MSVSEVWECVCVCVGEEVFVGGRESVWESVGCGCWRACVCVFAHVTNSWMLDTIGTPDLLNGNCSITGAYLFTCLLVCLCG